MVMLLGLQFCITDYGSVHSAYNPSFSACFFSRNNIFLSQQSANSVFQPAYQHNRTAPDYPFHMAINLSFYYQS
jgi:hypothetical protein